MIDVTYLNILTVRK